MPARSVKRSKSARRRLLKTLTMGGGAVTAAKLMPARWARPVVASVMLPAHAQATGSCTNTESILGELQFVINTTAGTMISTNLAFGINGPINTANGSFSVSGGGIYPCLTGIGSGTAVFTGTLPDFSGSIAIYCDGTRAFYCTQSTATLGTNTALLGITCTQCTDLLGID